MAKGQGKETGGPWDCFDGCDFYGWEAEKVVVVTDGTNVMELITRAKIHLAVILVDDGVCYTKTKKHIQDASDQGLVEMMESK